MSLRASVRTLSRPSASDRTPKRKRSKTRRTLIAVTSLSRTASISSSNTTLFPSCVEVSHKSERRRRKESLLGRRRGVSGERRHVGGVVEATPLISLVEEDVATECELIPLSDGSVSRGIQRDGRQMNGPRTLFERRGLSAMITRVETGKGRERTVVKADGFLKLGAATGGRLEPRLDPDKSTRAA